MRLVPLDVPRRAFGDSGLSVPALGFGAGQIGGDDLSEHQAGTLLNRAVDLGVTLIDTAPGYGLSEARIGRHLAHRRDDFVLVSKCGYGVPGVPDWSPACVRAGIDRALITLQTDHIDVLLLHSCPAQTLDVPGLLDALDEAKRAGKILLAGYSGENDALDHAIETGRLGAIETSLNVFDQRSSRAAVPVASQRGLGVIAKRPLGNAPWRFSVRPSGHYAETYWQRMRAMGTVQALPATSEAWHDRALRFSAFAPGVATAIVGTSSTEHLQASVEVMNRGALAEDEAGALREAFEIVGAEWRGEV